LVLLRLSLVSLIHNIWGFRFWIFLTSFWR
jgi:hypothetical protein